MEHFFGNANRVRESVEYLRLRLRRSKRQMFQLEFSEAEVNVLAYERYHHRHSQVQREKYRPNRYAGSDLKSGDSIAQQNARQRAVNREGTLSYSYV